MTTHEELVAKLEAALAERKECIVRGLIEARDLGGSTAKILGVLSKGMDESFARECLREADARIAKRDELGL